MFTSSVIFSLIFDIEIFVYFQYEKALSYTESHVKQLHRFSIYTVGRHYINNLIENCEFDQAGALLSRIFRGEN